MKIVRQPVVTTILFGLACAVLFVPLTSVLTTLTYWPMSFRIIIWAYCAGYAWMLAKWGRVSLLSLVFPLLLLLLFVFLSGSISAFLLFTMGVVSWIRSGICFKGSLGKTLGAELLVCLGGGIMVAAFEPHTIITWAVAIWMFFLVQSLYFVLFTKSAETEAAEEENVDLFERARRRVEAILDSNL